MSIRSNAILLGDTLSPQLKDILRRNGMNAQVTMEGNQYMLHVQGHDSPMISYKISRNQYLAMVDGGTNSANKHAYKTFVNIVNRDFDCPKNYVHARNANSQVTMGLHGYRVQDRGMQTPPFFRHDMPFDFHRPMLGWTPRQQDGYHLRRIGGELYAGGPMVPERRDGYMKPGELQSGAYGFYYKGDRQQQVQTDPLKELQTVVKPVEVKAEPAKAYRDLISSAVYFTNDKWQECLQSHGITIDEQNKKLLMTNYGTSYNLTDEQIKELTNNSLKGDSVYHRIDVINGVIGTDFQDKLTFDMLNSKEQPNLHLKPEVEQTLNTQYQQKEQIAIADPLQEQQMHGVGVSPGLNNSDGVNGHDLDGSSKGWYRQVANGREVSVGDIWVEKDQEHEGKYKMSAIINGEVISHEIKQKDYDKFLALDDYHRMKMFDKVFDEVKMKTHPGQGMNFGQALMAGLGVATTLTRGAAEIAHDIEHIKHPHGDGVAPVIIAEEHHHGRVFVKPGLDTPESVASRIFEAGMSQGYRDAVMHHR